MSNSDQPSLEVSFKVVKVREILNKVMKSELEGNLAVKNICLKNYKSCFSSINHFRQIIFR